MPSDRLERAYRATRPHLLDIAYRMLGSRSDAEDVVQEAFARLLRVPEPQDTPGWLAVVVSRLCVDHLRSASRRASYQGLWLPEPVCADPAGTDPADRVTIDETVSMALLVVLEQLSPAERAAFILHDVFAMPFGKLASILSRSPAACRQLASRARRRIREQNDQRFRWMPPSTSMSPNGSSVHAPAGMSARSRKPSTQKSSSLPTAAARCQQDTGRFPGQLASPGCCGAASSCTRVTFTRQR